MPGAVISEPFDAERIRAEDEEVLRAIDIGDRHQELMAVHQKTGEHLRQLIHRSRGEVAVRTEGAREKLAEDQRAVVVDHGIALVHRHRRAAVRLLDFVEPGRRLVDRVVPGDLLEVAAPPAKRAAQPVGIGVKILKGDRLGADVTAAERIVLVAADLLDRSPRVSITRPHIASQR